MKIASHSLSCKISWFLNNFRGFNFCCWQPLKFSAFFALVDLFASTNRLLRIYYNRSQSSHNSKFFLPFCLSMLESGSNTVMSQWILLLDVAHVCQKRKRNLFKLEFLAVFSMVNMRLYIFVNNLLCGFSSISSNNKDFS